MRREAKSLDVEIASVGIAETEREHCVKAAFDWLDRLPVLTLISAQEQATAHRRLVELLLLERFDAARAAIGRLTWKKR